MNLKESKYNQFDLVKEMLETPGVLEKFDFDSVKSIAGEIKNRKRVFLTGEGSSRIFPAKNFISKSKQHGSPVEISAEGSRQSAEYDLDGHVVIGASNSGRTKEIVELFNKLKDNPRIFPVALTSNHDTPLEKLCILSHVLNCGKENAIAATKSSMEQALFYLALLAELENVEEIKANLKPAARAIDETLKMQISPEIIRSISKSKIIHFAGRNNGVAEELALKTNEVARKNSVFFEGTYVIHGAQEVLDSQDTIVLVEPFKEEMAKYKDVLVGEAGMNVIAVSKDETPFPTIKIPSVEHYNEFIQLASGWNLLVEAGVSLSVNLDKPIRAHKVAQ